MHTYDKATQQEVNSTNAVTSTTLKYVERDSVATSEVKTTVDPTNAQTSTTSERSFVISVPDLSLPAFPEKAADTRPAIIPI